MAQQLNLLDARFSPQPRRYSARQGLLAMAMALFLSAVATQTLRWATGRALAENLALQHQIAPLKAQRQTLGVAENLAPETELAQLRRLEAGHRRIAAALDAGVAGAREGHADYLEALARRASAALWITGFAVTEDGAAIELTGRMADASVLTDYLRSLNAEPRFKGRPFAQLSLKSVDKNGQPLPFTEFALLSRATPSAGSTP